MCKKLGDPEREKKGFKYGYVRIQQKRRDTAWFGKPESN